LLRKEGDETVAGTFPINNIYVKVLFDTRENRSFISNTLVPYLDQEPEVLEKAYIVKTARGEQNKVTTIFKNFTISLA
jgi:hypothetical protein